MPGPENQNQPGGQSFSTTHWSVVLRAARDGTQQAAALEELCKNYWPPIYGYVRRRGYAFEEAQDLTQGFFARLLEKGWLEDVDPNRARFRSFLLTMISRYLANEYHRANAAKRGGYQLHFSIHDEALENQLASPAHFSSPEQDFDRRWALTVLNRAMERLKAELTASGKSAYFEHLCPLLSQEPEPGAYERISRMLEISEGAIAVAVHRLRHRYRDLIRTEVGETLLDPTDTDQELQHLFESLRPTG